ncbi:MAG: endonuclease/exonuclease/phosphatase family protein [bacterium]
MVSGQGFLNRYPIEMHKRVVLARPENIPFYYDAFYLERLAQIVKIDVGRPVYIINIHLEAYNQETGEKQARTVLEMCKKLINDFPFF